MKPYLITGCESLIHAAFKEAFEAFGKGAQLPSSGLGPYKELYINSSTEYWLSVSSNQADRFLNRLALPADWDKLMGILAELKKPKLPDYVRAGLRDKVFKVYGNWDGQCGTVLDLYDVYGKEDKAQPNGYTPITEQEFIEGGLKELAEAGYVKGAKVECLDSGYKNDFVIEEIVYQTQSNDGRHSGLSYKEVHRFGFSFTLTGQGYRAPVSGCTLVPALPTTSQGIPYLILDGEAMMGVCGSQCNLSVSTLRYLLKRGVTELVTKAGRLTHADLVLLTK